MEQENIVRTKEEYLALLNETVQYYSEDTSRRALSKLTCLYKTNDGKMCAVGRCLKEGVIDYNHHNSLSVSGLLEYYKEEEIFKQEYVGFDERFWLKLQGLHDEFKYWGENCLNPKGELLVERIERFIDGLFGDKK